MGKPLFIEIDGRRYAWKALEALKREQLALRARAVQPVLFPLMEDCRPQTERRADGRYAEPGLFGDPAHQPR